MFTINYGIRAIYRGLRAGSYYDTSYVAKPPSTTQIDQNHVFLHSPEGKCDIPSSSEGYRCSGNRLVMDILLLNDSPDKGGPGLGSHRGLGHEMGCPRQR